MVNEEKAKEISQQWWGCGKQQQITAYEAAIEAMAWKDEQEIEFLQSLMFQASTQQALNIIINNRIKLLKGK